MLANKPPLSDEYVDRRCNSPHGLRRLSIFKVKYWLPQTFWIFTMGLVITILIVGVIDGALLEPHLDLIVKFWCRAAIIVTCLIAIAAIYEANP
jgi:hypothetical protein